MTTNSPDELEAQFELWRGYVRRRKELTGSDAEELEDHLRGSVAELIGVGLRPDEAFLVAVKRMGNLDELSREFAREHSERLWTQLVLGGGGDDEAATTRSRRDIVAMLICAAGAVVSIKAPELFGQHYSNATEETVAFYARNFTLFGLPWLAAFLTWRRRPRPLLIGILVALFAAGAVAANVYPLGANSQSLVLTAVHLPIVLWVVVGLSYAGDEWRSSRRRMDFIRFSGEWFIYFVLIALGGVVLTAFTFAIFTAIDIEPSRFVSGWLIPCGAMAAVVVAGWLVEVKQGVVENIAPVLTRLFTPLFTAIMLAFLVAFLWTNRGFTRHPEQGMQFLGIDRDTLITFDLLLAVVLGLLLYTISARDPLAGPGLFDRLQLGLVVSALLIDALVFVEITGRISEWGSTPNRAAALGENVVLLVNLVWSAWLLLSLLRRRKPFEALERWQTAYLPVYAVWAAVVVVVFPPLFDLA
jgi:hypothetical protein